MAGVCEACKGNITVTQKRIKCIHCLHLYHSECINFNNESRTQWKCPKCVAAHKKGGDNSNTPVRGSKWTSQSVECVAPTASLPTTSSGQSLLSELSASSAPASIVSPNMMGTSLSATASNENLGASKDLVSRMEVLLDMKLKAAITDIAREIKSSFTAELRNELASVLSGLSQLEESHNSLLKEHDTLKTEHEELKRKVSQNENQIHELRGHLSKQQQWARISNIEIVGLPETSSESPVELVTKIAKHAGILLKPEEIESAHRVQPMQKFEGRPKPIVVKLRNRLLKDKIISGLRKSRGITTSDIGLGGSSRRFFVNEHLTPENKNLLKLAKLRGQEKAYKFVWVRNCNIFLRKNEESHSVAINSEKDLLKIV